MSIGRQEIERREAPPPASPQTGTTAVATSRGLSLNGYLSRSGAAPIAIALTVFGMFLPVVIVSYAFSDDYPILSTANGLDSSPYFGKTVVDAFSANGRPFAGLLSSLAFSLANTIDNLRFVRLFALLAIVALALVLHWALVRSGIGPTPAALIAVLVCCGPAFQVFASWAVLFTAPYAALLSAGASLLAAWVANSEATAWDGFVGATAMLFAALLIYQPAAMFFWVFLAVALIGAAREPPRTMRLLRAHAGIAAAALPLAFLLGKLAAHKVGNSTPNATRTALTHDAVGKVQWFVQHPLYQSLNLFDLTRSAWFAAVVAVVAVIGIALLLRRESSTPALHGVTAAALVPLAFLPNLVAKENNSLVFRTQVSLSALLALYAGLGALGIWLAVRDRLEPRVSGRGVLTGRRTALAVSAAVVAIGVFVAARNVLTLVVEPQSTELRMIRSQVADVPTGAARVGFVQIGWNEGITKRYYSDEIGLPSSARPWTPEPAILLILREEGRLQPGAPRPAVDVFLWTTTSFPKGEPLIDMRGLQRLR